MKDEEVLEHIYKCYEERECIRCAIWDAAAKEYGKRGICEECFDMHYNAVECNIERLGMPLLIEWKNKDEVLKFLPE